MWVGKLGTWWQRSACFPRSMIFMLNESDENRARNIHDAPLTVRQAALLWMLFFLICLGLGYAPLNRYDPGQLGGDF
jgi:hypothetical protein